MVTSEHPKSTWSCNLISINFMCLGGQNYQRNACQPHCRGGGENGGRSEGTCQVLTAK